MQTLKIQNKTEFLSIYGNKHHKKKLKEKRKEATKGLVKPEKKKRKKSMVQPKASRHTINELNEEDEEH